MKAIPLLTLALCCAALLVCCLAHFVSAEDEVVYLGDRKDLMLPRDYEDAIGWNTAHSGEKITTWELSFAKGIGFHCREKGLAYVEFDISSLGMNYFYATVGVLKEASYYMDEGSIIFRVYGDGKLLYETPVIKWAKKPVYICVPVTDVKTLRLEEDNAGSYICDAGVWGDAALCKTEPEAPEWWTRLDPNNTDLPQKEEVVSGDRAYVSDLYFTAFTGEAECRDRNTAGEYIVTYDGKYYPKGIGFHAATDYTTYIDVNIADLGYTKFCSYYGISATLSKYDITMANIKFAVFGDGKKLFESKAVKWGDEMKYIECDITGVKTLRLSVKGNPRIDGGWGTFAGALLSKSGEVNDGMFYTDYMTAFKPSKAALKQAPALIKAAEPTVTPKATPEQTQTPAQPSTPEQTPEPTQPQNPLVLPTEGGFPTAAVVALASVGAIGLIAGAYLFIKRRKKG